VIFTVFLESRAGEAERYEQENNSRDFQPQLVYGVGKRSAGGASRAHQRVEGAAALRLLASHAGHDSSLPPGGKFAHSLDFNSRRRYNDATHSRTGNRSGDQRI
jgi:hypothetical protein